MNKKPFCQDGISCQNKNEGFLAMNYLDNGKQVLKFVCFQCAEQRQNQKHELLLKLHENLLK